MSTNSSQHDRYVSLAEEVLAVGLPDGVTRTWVEEQLRQCIDANVAGGEVSSVIRAWLKLKKREIRRQNPEMPMPDDEREEF